MKPENCKHRITIEWMEKVLAVDRVDELLSLAQKNKNGRRLLARYITANVNLKIKGQRTRGDGKL